MEVKEQDIIVSDGRRRSGWFWVDNEVFDLQLKPSVFMVYCFLVRIADRSSEVACISIRKMAKILGMSPWTVQKALKELESLNMIKKYRRETKKGNKLASAYRLTPKEDWMYQKLAQGVPENGTGVCQKMAQGVPKNGTPPSLDLTEVVELQAKDESNPSPINTYKDQKSKDQKSIDHHHHIGGGGDETQSLELMNCKNGIKHRTAVSKGKKPSALKNSAGPRKAENPEEIYGELLEKWKDVLEGVKLERLSVAQAIFFLENSALPPEQTLEAILRDDRNPNVKNPVGTLYSTLPLKSDKYRWLLKMADPPSIEDEEWYQRYVRKLAVIKEFFSRHGITLPEREITTEKEAQEHLKELERKAFEIVWNRLDPERKKELKARARKILGNGANNGMIITALMALLSDETGLPSGAFSLYTY